MGAYLQLLRDHVLTLTAALDTRVHADHIAGLGELREATGCRSWMDEQSAASCVSARFGEGTEIAFGRHRLRALYTPGHTDDSYCFLLEADGQRYAFTGDTLLIRGTGRTDFQNGSAHEQYHSLFARLMTWPDDPRVYPGHDYKGWTVSSIGEERACNPRLQVKDEASYVEQMDSLRLPNPRLMDVAVPANHACGRSARGLASKVAGTARVTVPSERLRGSCVATSQSCCGASSCCNSWAFAIAVRLFAPVLLLRKGRMHQPGKG